MADEPMGEVYTIINGEKVILGYWPVSKIDELKALAEELCKKSEAGE